MNRTGAKVATVLAAALLLGATACGGGDKKEASASDLDATSATTVEKTASDDTTSDDLSDLADELDSLDDLDALGGDCLSAASAYGSIGMNILSYMGGATSEQIEQLEGQVDELKAEIPSEIQDDFQVFADGVAEYAAAMEGVDMSDILDPDVQDRMTEAGEALDSSEMTQAQANLDDYFAENCS